MQEVISFFRDHYKLVAMFIVELVTLIILIFKKKVKIQDWFTSVLSVLPDLISLAERKFATGTEKYSFVFNRAVDMLVQLTHKAPKKIIEEYATQINSAIESILSTPQKKER